MSHHEAGALGSHALSGIISPSQAASLEERKRGYHRAVGRAPRSAPDTPAMEDPLLSGRRSSSRRTPGKQPHETRAAVCRAGRGARALGAGPRPEPRQRPQGPRLHTCTMRTWAPWVQNVRNTCPYWDVNKKLFPFLHNLSLLHPAMCSLFAVSAVLSRENFKCELTSTSFAVPLCIPQCRF